MADSDWNTGDRNTGDRNTGNWNTGDWNTGDLNTGDRNTGDRNTGDRNTGNWNTGNRNTGDLNTGNWNTGNRNTGNWNTGNWNTGNLNTGNWNTGNWNTGFFCTETPSATFFDGPCGLTHEEARNLIPVLDLPIGVEWVPSNNMSPEEKEANPNYTTIGGYLKKHVLPLNESFPVAWAKMDSETKQRFLDLPNFNANKFKEITGIDVRDKEKDAIASRVAELSEEIDSLKAKIEALSG